MSRYTDFFTKRMQMFSRIDPERDWIVLLFTSILALMGIIVWNAWVFDTIASGGTIGSPAPITAPAFNQSSLDAVHTLFTNRAAEEAKYVSGTYRYADPSL